MTENRDNLVCMTYLCRKIYTMIIIGIQHAEYNDISKLNTLCCVMFTIQRAEYGWKYRFLVCLTYFCRKICTTIIIGIYLAVYNEAYKLNIHLAEYD